MDDRASLASALSGRYDIDREIGRGGMATVYLARDIRHDRRVALKLLNPELGAVLGAERFLSEIKVTANLQHPNLLPLFDSGEADGLLFYVMPFVEGETLRHRLDREKQLSVDESIRIAVAIANALDYAHRHGVIHRDLKPENVLLQDGQPLVADFGIALAVSNAGGQRVTQTGLSLGTPQYMSPEQATGDRSIDGRTDIYSLGAITYEMLAGEPPHSGTTAQAIIARLMTEQPRSLVAARRNVPAHVDAAVHCALEKLPADRFATAKEFADALQGRGRVATTSSVATRQTIAPSRALVAAAVIAGVAAITFAAAWWRERDRPLPPPLRFALDVGEGIHVTAMTSGNNVAVSPDGQSIAYLTGAPRRLYVRRLDRLGAVSFSRLPNPSDPHFSLDGRSIAIMSGGVQQMQVDGNDSSGQPTMLAPTIGWNGLSWAPSREILWVFQDSLWQVAPNGGARSLVAAGDVSKEFWSNVAALPGDMVAFRLSPTVFTSGGPADRLALVSRKGGKPIVTELPFQNVIGYVDGILIFGQVGGRISAVKFDAATGKIQGEPVVVVENAAFKPAGGVSASMGDDGTLAYIIGSTQATQQIVDERGAVIAAIPEQKNYVSPSWSPDGTRIAMGVFGAAGYDLWLYDLRSKLLTRMGPSGYRTAWTPDGKHLAFVDDNANGRVMWMPWDGSSAPVPVPGTDGLIARQVVFSPDGKYAAVQTSALPSEAPGVAHLFAIPLGGGQRIPVMPEVRNPNEPAISPNGKWISYSSTESGEAQVVVRPFPSGTGRVQISTGGGWEGKWSRDGTKLYFRDGSVVRAAVLDITGAMPRVVRVDSLFADVWVNNASAFSWDVAQDGKRFVMRRESGDARIIIEKNWLPQLRAKLK